MTTLSRLFLALLPITLEAAELPEPILPAGVGVNIHFVTGHLQDLDKIAAAGFKFVRMDFSWGGTERERGVYDWSQYDQLQRNLAQRGLRAIFILDYSNPRYEETVTSTNPLTGKPQADLASPRHPESVAAFARWAGEAVNHFRGSHIIWEIWNEPNISFWKPKPNVEEYNALALAAAKQIKQRDPEATLMGPASSEFPWPFLESFLSSGILEYLDAVSVHPYRSYKKAPETAVVEYRRLREMIERFGSSPQKKALPIISGEWGYASHTKGVSLDIQAAFLVRQQLSNLLNGIPLSIWYDWKNDGPDAEEREHNFGTVTSDLQPKPAYTAIQTLTRELSGYRIVRRIEADDAQDFILLLANPQGLHKLAAWTTGADHEISLAAESLGKGQPKLVNWKGESTAIELAGGRLKLELGMHPQYIQAAQP